MKNNKILMRCAGATLLGLIAIVFSYSGYAASPGSVNASGPVVSAFESFCLNQQLDAISSLLAKQYPKEKEILFSANSITKRGVLESWPPQELFEVRGYLYIKHQDDTLSPEIEKTFRISRRENLGKDNGKNYCENFEISVGDYTK